MTDISNVILITAMDDGACAHSDHAHADLINDFLTRHYQGDRLNKVDHHGGGKKAMPLDMFIGAIDYLDRERLLEFYNQIPWDNPDRVQLMIQGRKDNGFTLYKPLCSVAKN